MKKHAVMVIVAGIIFIGISVKAQEAKSSNVKPDLSGCERVILVDRNNDGVIDGIDGCDTKGRVVVRGYDTRGDKNVNKWVDYDVNTGLPIVTSSDNAYNLGGRNR